MTKEEIRELLDKKAKEQYNNSNNGFAVSSFGLDGIPFVRRDAIADFVYELLNKPIPIKASEESEDELWNRVIAVVATFEIMKNTIPGDAASIIRFKKKATDELKSQFLITRRGTK